MNVRPPRLSGWQWVLAGVLVYVVVVLALSRPPGLVGGVRFFGVPTDDPTFGDLANILAAVECDRLGYDVLVENPCDPMSRPMNYPRIWLALGELGLDLSWLTRTGILLGLAFLAGCLWLLRGIAASDAGVCLGFILSPAVVLLVERGNNDIVVFCLLALGSAALSRSSFSRRLVGYALVLLASVLKLYPIAAGLTVLRERGRQALVATVLLVGSMGAYGLAVFDQLAQIARVTPRAAVWSYGFGVLPYQVAAQAARLGLSVSETTVRAVAWAGLALTASACVTWAVKLRPRMTAQPRRELAEERLAFVIGAAVYGTTFLMGFNWSYRLAFLIFCLPLMTRWRRVPHLRRLATLFLAAALATAWLGFFVPLVHVFSLSVTLELHLAALFSWLVLLSATTALLLLLPRLGTPAFDERSSPSPAATG